MIMLLQGLNAFVKLVNDTRKTFQEQLTAEAMLECPHQFPDLSYRCKFCHKMKEQAWFAGNVKR